MKTEETSFENSKNIRISAKIYSNEPFSKKGIIFCHGLFSSKDSFKITRMAENIVKAGFTLFTFDFSFAGESQGDYSDVSLLDEMEDLKDAVNFFKKYDIETIHIIGSSMGGVVSLLYASLTPDDLASLTIIATPFHLVKTIVKISGVEDIASLPDDGMTDISGIFVKNSFFKEAININLKEAIKKVKAPTLVLSGSSDELVDIESTQDLYDNLNSEKELSILEGGNHSLAKIENIDSLQGHILQWVKKHS